MTTSAPPEMPTELWAKLIELGSPRFYPAGSLLFAEGDPAGPVMAILSGVVDVTIGTEPTAISEVTIGDVVGELSAIDGLPRSASATARTDVSAVAVPIDRFVPLVAQDARLGLYLLRCLAARVRRRTEELARKAGGLPLPHLASLLLRDRTPAMADLVADLGVTHEVLSRGVDALVERQVVAIEDGRILVLDPIVLAGIGETTTR